MTALSEASYLLYLVSSVLSVFRVSQVEVRTQQTQGQKGGVTKCLISFFCCRVLKRSAAVSKDCQTTGKMLNYWKDSLHQHQTDDRTPVGRESLSRVHILKQKAWTSQSFHTSPPSGPPWDLILEEIWTEANGKSFFDPVGIVPWMTNMMFVNLKDLNKVAVCHQTVKTRR